MGIIGTYKCREGRNDTCKNDDLMSIHFNMSVPTTVIAVKRYACRPARRLYSSVMFEKGVGRGEIEIRRVYIKCDL